MAEIARRDVFQAVADPTRRRIIELVMDKPMNVISIAAQLEMTQPAISQQIKILNECGIIEIETLGRERLCKVKPENLIPAFMWLEQFKQQWTSRIDSFENYVNELQAKNNKLKKKKK
jgi:DNA-binding transcriptional ArsR family regulator